MRDLAASSARRGYPAYRSRHIVAAMDDDQRKYDA